MYQVYVLTCFIQLINDAIHGPVKLTPLLYQIINTSEFHRLKDIKQLGILIIMHIAENFGAV